MTAGIDLPKLLRFGSGAALSFTSTLAITYAAVEWLGLDEKLSFAISLVGVFFINFWYLRLFVFQSELPWIRQLRDFFVASIGFRIAEYLAFLVLLDIFEIQYLLCVISVLVVSFVAKFFVFNFRIFT